MCTCIERVNERLKPLGHQLAMGFAITNNGFNVVGRLLLRTERAGDGSRPKKAAPTVPAAYCPFCGEKAQVPE